MPPSPWSQELYIAAYKFAAQAHRWQRVPGTRLPYIMHLSFVAMEIMAAISAEELAPPQADLALQCALLHDVLEDTRVRFARLYELFGEDVANGVQALTVNKKLPRDEQMVECLPRIRQQPREIWMVKLADRITNLQPPPPHWSKKRIRDYHREAQAIRLALEPTSPFLSARLSVMIQEYAAFTA